MAELALIPLGYKTAVVYSELPVNGDGDFAFARNSLANRVGEDGLIEEMAIDVPRLDFLNESCPELLIEPQSTNLLKYSEDFTQVNWSKLNAGNGVLPIITANAGVSPDGTLNASRIQLNQGVDSGGDDYSIVRQVVSPVDGYCSVWMKSYDGTSYTVDMTADGNAKATVVTNVWQRFSDYRASASRVHISLRNSVVNDTADLLIWGGQLEAVGNTAPTSYIKTEGSTVTRLADVANVTVLAGLSQAIETIDSIEQSPVAVTPSTLYQIPEGRINSIIMT